MNTPSSILSLPLGPQPLASDRSAPALETPTATPESGPLRSDHRRTGKVASLPKALRERISRMIEDGLTYARIIESLGEDGKHLTLDNLSQWKKGGYQDWLKDQFWQAEMRARVDSFTGLLAGADPIQLPEGGLQLAAVGICELLRELCQPGGDTKPDPIQYVRVANSLARLSRSILQLQQYRDTAAKAKTLELKRLEANRELAEAERTALLDRADDLFGFKSAQRLRTESLRQSSAPPFEISNMRPATLESAPAPTPKLGVQNSAVPPSELSNLTSEIASVPLAVATSLPPAGAAIQNQNSKIETPLVLPGSADSLSAVSESCTVSAAGTAPAPTPKVEVQSPPVPPSELSNLTSEIASVPLAVATSLPPADAPIQNQNSKIQNPFDLLCPTCGVSLPPLRPDGQRPFDRCPACSTHLYPPGTPFDYCPWCETPQPLPNNQRLSSECGRCGSPLPPPGQRFVTRCPKCQARLPNLTNLGQRLSDRCPDCHAPVPLLEPNPISVAW